MQCWGWQGNGHNPRAGGTLLVRFFQWRASGTRVLRTQLPPRTAYGVNKIACILHAGQACLLTLRVHSLHSIVCGIYVTCQRHVSLLTQHKRSAVLGDGRATVTIRVPEARYLSSRKKYCSSMSMPFSSRKLRYSSSKDFRL